jgi:CspA family cold shock protein
LASLQINHGNISSIADRIVQARRLYGADSSYVIGLFTSLEWLLDGSGGESVRRQMLDRVVEVEGGKAAPAPAQTPSSRPGRPEASAPRGRGEGLEENTWIRGAVKWFNNDKGYGFISTAADTDVFVHWRDISSWDRSLTQGDEVEFMVTKTAKGFQAINVMKPGSGESSEDATRVAGQEAEAQELGGLDEESGELSETESAVASESSEEEKTDAALPVAEAAEAGAAQDGEDDESAPAPS